MQDNFNLKGYLRHGNKLLNEGIGGYFDLRPLNELDFGNDDSEKITIDLDMGWDDAEDDAAQATFQKYHIDVQGNEGQPGTYQVTGKKEDILAYLKSPYYDMDDETIEEYYPELLSTNEADLEGEVFLPEDFDEETGGYDIGAGKSNQYDGQYDSEHGPAIANEDTDRYDNYDRIFDLGGNQIEQGIISLLDDGFEMEDILEFVKVVLEDQAGAKAMGKKY